MTLAKNAHDTSDLINKIDRYISDHESRQLELLKDLATLSKKVYGYDKTIEKYSENIELFQSFFSTKNQLNSLAEHLVEEERARTAAAIEEQRQKQEMDELRRQQELRLKQELEQQRREQVPQPIIDSVDFVTKPLVHQQQIVDVKITETKQTLCLEQPPRFIRHLNDIAVVEGDKYRFVCQLQSTQPSTQIEWCKDGIPITNYPHYEVHNENGLCTLSIDETFTEDSATFTCRATNHLGSSETSGRLSIQHNEQAEMLFPPHFVRPLTHCKTSGGSSLVWKCFVEGNPLPTIQWFKHDECIDVSLRYNISYNNGEATLQIDHLACDDAGVFTCIAKNILGVDQCSATLTVTAAPQSIDSLLRNG